MFDFAPPEVPFCDLRPTRRIWVNDETGSDDNSGEHSSPYKTLQAAVDAAVGGTAVVAQPGRYGSVVFTKTQQVTSIEKPIWLLAEIPLASEVVHSGTASQRAIAGTAEQNIVIEGFSVFGGHDGIYFGLGTVNGVKNVYSRNIVIKNCAVRGDTQITEDGIKIDHTYNVHCIGNSISDIKEQAIDYLAVVGGSIQKNKMSKQLPGTNEPMCFVKGGSSDIQILDNVIAGVQKDGLSVGGWTEPQFAALGAVCEARNILVQGNRISAGSKRPILILGGQEILLRNNLLIENPGYFYALTIGTGSPSSPSKSYSKNVAEVTNRYTGAGRVQVENGNAPLLYRKNNLYMSTF